ncbi:hypothetical protein BBJ28_00008120 [Nothophytophthora sp. Chile5]|nr:hypothetical protein BBJ28_00008120 [Nothophytophthora sp. Chile5]
MLSSVLRRSGGARALRSRNTLDQISCVRRSLPATAAAALQLPHQQQTRTLLTQRQLTGYVMSRAKVLQLAARSFLAYNQIMELDNATSSVSHFFARSATLRERVTMFIVCLIPPDEPLDLPMFIAGAKQAAHVVFHQLYANDTSSPEPAVHLGDYPPPLTEMASSECVATWASKLQEQRRALHIPEGTKFVLEKLEVQNVTLAEVEYTYASARSDQQPDTRSVFRLNEALRMKVRFAVTEHLLDVATEEEGQQRRHTLKTTFDWCFSSDVSRAHLIDWYITGTTPFKLELATDKQDEETKVPAPA